MFFYGIMASMDGHFRSPYHMEIVCYSLSFRGTSFQYSVIQLYLSLVEIRNPYLNLVGCSILSDKDEGSIVITCSTFVNPESSITATHSPLMNVSPRIRLYFDILSNKIKKGTCPSGQVPLLNMSELTYSSTAA